MRAGRIGDLRLLVDEDRQQRAATVLRDVAYVIEASFAMTAKAGPDDPPGKHLDMFNRRARTGRCFHQPCLGCREFPASFALLEPGVPPPPPHPDLGGTRELGWMLLDVDYANERASRFFKAVMIDGVIEVPAMDAVGTVA